MPARSSEAMFRELPLFAQLDDSSELHEVLALATRFSVDAGAVLFRQGDESDGMYVIADGEVVVRARVPGTRKRSWAAWDRAVSWASSP